jgi:Tol biopolymer transport system component
VQSVFDETQPSISPDGRWLAYMSDESGRAEIYVRALGAAGAPMKITTGGASAPEWGRGDRLIYTTESGQTVAATIASSASSFVVARLDTINMDGVRMAVEPHTDRILVTRPPADRRIIVVSNWLSELRAKLKRGGA